ncbi:DNA topoisomerase IV subunit A [Clostridium swellfunianum]|uniref:DNA topoisomerase IV subunit A n=1 Tax=Clostridium swellfunianum TaxID=1367462 RepID=UPI00203093D8|nr:DNA topoisomerase IV subunit A [Clostridium swellfunianum]MCM0650495.1 DNA topoisomerase IV subunit A [Clostridium swellfunianum]
MAKKIDIPKDGNIVKVPIEEAMPENYLPYAVEVAKDRALPDARDGLKPVHRRIIYGAYMLKAFPDKPYYKSARIVGDILGKFHPHGDSSVYEAMVILAQDFSTRKPLIDGHGNWGSQDGDSAAAMRYTEARLTKLAMEMIRDMDKDVVDMMENYSGTELEPKVLPSRYPNLLVNGAFGIAVGLATNIPPHNLNEVIDGALAYIDNNNITTNDLLQYIKGPDLPTGGIIIGKNSLLSAYETGEGKVTLRAKAYIEKLENGRLGIVITEFPYRKSKAKLLQTISEMTDDKRHAKALEAITDIRDESDRNGIRAVIELKKVVDMEGAEKLLKYLYKKTDLQSNVSFNMVALANGKPATMGLKTMLMHYVNHQREVVTRRTQRELQIAEKRFHIVEGFIKAIDILDEIIAVIRASKSKKDSELNLMNTFGFTEVQAQAIVELMLYRLTGLEIKAFEKEHRELEKEIKRLRKILESEKELLKVIRAELTEVKEKYGDARRTEVIENDEEAKIDIEELIIVEDTVVTLSNEGYIKRVPLKSYNRSNSNVEDIDFREGDFNKFLFESNTKHTVLFFTDKGNMYQLKGTAIPEFRWKEKGERLDAIIRGLDLSLEKIISVYSVEDLSIPKDFIFITSKGNMKKTSVDKFISAYTKLVALRVKEDETLIKVNFVEKEREEKFIKLTTKQGLYFTVLEPNIESADRNIASTSLVQLPTKEEIIDAEFVSSYEYKEFFLAINEDGIVRQVASRRNITKKEKGVFTNTNEKLLIFLDNGSVINISANIFSSLKEEGLNLIGLLNNDSNIKVLNVLGVKDFTNSVEVLFISKKGLVKKTKLEEFSGDYLNTQAYKLKTEEDELIAVDYTLQEDNKDIIIVTRKALCIRFKSSDIPAMGKVASGVIGISLKEEDEAVFAALVTPGDVNATPGLDEIALASSEEKELVLVTSKKNKLSVKLGQIKQQNRAGKGTNLTILVFDEIIKEGKIN